MCEWEIFKWGDCNTHLAVDGQRNALVLVQDGLGASVDADNGETLVDEDGVVGGVVATPIGTAMLHLLAHA